MNMHILIFVFLLFIRIAFHANACSSDMHEYDYEIDIEETTDDPDDFLYDLTQTQLNDTAAPSPEKYLQKAMRAYDERKYRHCFEYIKQYERALENYEANIPYQYNQLTKKQKVLIYSYKAYCKKALKSYEIAQEYFEELIKLMKQGGYQSECLFTAYWQYASCYYFMGQKDKCKDRMIRLVNLGIGPTIEELKSRGFRLNRQPCFHEHALIKSEKMVINEIIATSLGKQIVALDGKYIPTFCTCTNEDSSFCNEWCTRIGSYATVACAFIPNKTVQALALFALAEFQVNCELCCEKGLGHENCCRILKKAIQHALNQERLDEI